MRMLIVDRFGNMVFSTEKIRPVRGNAVVSNSRYSQIPKAIMSQ